jgi:hypothetical protein
MDNANSCEEKPRLADAQPLRRASEIQLLGDSDEIVKMAQFH